MLRVIGLFTPYRSRLAVVLVLISASSALSLAPAFLIRELLDVAIPQRRIGYLWLLAGGILAVAVVANVLNVVQSYLSLRVGQEVMNDLRTSVYTHLQSLSLGFFNRTKSGEIQSRIANDIGGLDATITSLATTFMSGLTSVLACLAAMVILDWRLTLASSAIIPVFAWVTRRIGSERLMYSRERQRGLATMSSMIAESLSVDGFLLGRVMGRSGDYVARFSQESDALSRLSVRAAMAGRWRQAAVQIMVAAMPMVIYVAGGYALAHGDTVISIGTLVAFTTLQQSLFGPVVQLLQAGIVVRSSRSLFERVFEYLDLPVEVGEPAEPVALTGVRGDVRFEKVSFAYDGAVVLRDVDLSVPAGCHVGVVGATGAGKSTLGRLVPRLYDVTAGRVTIDATDVRDLSFSMLANAVGYLSQTTHLLHTTIAENLRSARPEATDEDLVAAARAAHIHDLVAGLPEQYDTIVGEHGHRLSGGERQRIAIARAILRDSPILVLDESTSALDTETELAIQHGLATFLRNRTLITIAHRLSTVRDADEIVVLDEGRIIERGNHEQLMKHGGRYALMARRLSATVGSDLDGSRVSRLDAQS